MRRSGTTPGERGSRQLTCPIEQVSKFELVVKLRTAKAVDSIPESTLLRADEVIP